MNFDRKGYLVPNPKSSNADLNALLKMATLLDKEERQPLKKWDFNEIVLPGEPQICTLKDIGGNPCSEIFMDGSSFEEPLSQQANLPKVDSWESLFYI